MDTNKSNTAGKALGDFDEYAKDYRQVHNEFVKFAGADSDFFSEQKIRVVRSLETADRLNVLDLGCGDGNSARFFRGHFPDCSYTGLDTSQVSVELARSQNTPGSTFLHYDGDSVPFADASFDLVFVACVFHHIAPSAHREVIGEINRVLKPGGRLYIFEHNPLNPLTRRIVKNCPFDEDAILLGSGYTRKLLANADFQEIDIGYTIFFPNHRVFRGLQSLEPYLKWLPLGGQYYARAIKRGR